MIHFITVPKPLGEFFFQSQAKIQETYYLDDSNTKNVSFHNCSKTTKDIYQLKVKMQKTYYLDEHLSQNLSSSASNF